ncbi:LANO_0H02564g1_1 [Lachancea nothofagi CBS 11611]|uniref:LANO_0H02564g1_1 n=1 Tax=Lachancea nothofagi CBS 11611 TaxID=1266666 RepID=A0A1G4KKW6_9SACH|nr:LANO_0H02564g1_1 [Lachancea nothofagi CBS 11611]
MDAGTAAFSKKENSRAQVRSQLLNNDIGNINVAHERPTGANSPSQPFPGNFPSNFPSNNATYYQQQPATGQPSFQQERASYVAYPARDPRASSLTSQSTTSKRSLQSHGISNLFKLRSGRSKHIENDDDEETLMTDADNSILTFNDISSMRNNGGHKYGMGGGMDDTSPIIPTLITRGHDNMNNIEYRKHLAAQKKMTVNSLVNQKRANELGPSGDPRAMSLQYSHSPYVAQQQHPMMNGNQIPPYGRANSMMSGPPPQLRQWNPKMNGPHPPPGNGPRAMSLTSGARRRPMMPPPGGYRPQSGAIPPAGQGPPGATNFYGPTGPTGPAGSASRTSFQGPTGAYGPARSSVQGPSFSRGSPYVQAYPGHQNSTVAGPQYMPQHVQRPNSPLQSHDETNDNEHTKSASHLMKESETPLSSSSAMSINSLTSYRAPSQTPESQSAEDSGNIITMNEGQSESKQHLQKEGTTNLGKLNIIKLSDPKQKELRDKELQVTQKEKETQTKEPEAQYQEASKSDHLNALHSVSKEFSPKFHSSNSRLNNEQKDENDATTGQRRSQVQSMATFESLISNDSPVKRKNNQSTLYKLENSTDGNEYFTASELVDDVAGRSDNVSEVTITHKAAHVSTKETSTSEKQSATPPELERKDSGLGKARNFLRKLSSKNNKIDKSSTQTGQSSAGQSSASQSVKKNPSSDSISVIERTNGSEGKQFGTMKSENIKRKSFHSLFSNSSGGTNAGERVKSYSSLANINEKNVDEKPLVNQGPIFTVDGEESFNEDTLNDSDFDLPGASTSKEPALQQSHPMKAGGDPAQTVYRQDEGDEFNFDNTITKPYKPLYASQDELEPELDSQVPQKFKTISISNTQMSLLSEQNTLMSEIDLLSKELAESIGREARLEQHANGENRNNQDSQLLSIVDFEIELRKKSSKIVELIQQLNDERLRRYIAEEQIMLQENGVKPSVVDLVHKIHVLHQELANKEEQISSLTAESKD